MESVVIQKKLPVSEKFRVFADGKELCVICGAEYDYVHIYTDDIAAVEVMVSEKIEKAELRPSRRSKKITVDGERVKFVMSRADYYCLEINGDLARPLLLFCDEKIPFQVYDGYTVMYFKPYTYYKAGRIELGANTVFFIDEGAVVEGKIHAANAENLRIVGNGTLFAQSEELGGNSTVNLEKCTNVEINGVTVIGYHSWNIRLWQCKRVLIENVKILAYEVWSDGIDVVSCENVVIRHIFVKNEDDCVCIKSSVRKDGAFVGGDVRRVLVEDCVLWSGPRGNSLEIGYGTNNAVVENILFRNVDVVHRQTQETKFHRSIISIHNAGNAVIRNVTYENVYAEETEENFIQIAHMAVAEWGLGGGTIENIVLRNVSLNGGELRPSVISGTPRVMKEGVPACVTRNITFENLKIFGKKINSAEEAEENGFRIDEKAENVRFL